MRPVYRRLHRMIGVNLESDEFAAFERIAERHGQMPGVYARELLRREIERESNAENH